MSVLLAVYSYQRIVPKLDYDQTLFGADPDEFDTDWKQRPFLIKLSKPIETLPDTLFETLPHSQVKDVWNVPHKWKSELSGIV